MNNATEIIEAKLAAYIDGELTGADRVEIEAYLSAYPEHRKLIDEMSSHRTALRALPRENAPAEVLDHLQNHLERSALLDETPRVAGRIHRSPQWAAAAAVLVLAVGLGVAIYSVLPENGTDSKTVAIALPERTKDDKSASGLLNPATPTRGPEHEKFESPARGADAPVAVAPARVGKALLDAAGDVKAKADEPIRAAGAVEGVANTGVAADVTPPFALASPAAPLVNAPPEPALAVLIESDDPAITSNLVASYLADNKIAYERVDSAAVGLQATADRDDATMARSNSAPRFVPPTTREIEAAREQLRMQQQRYNPVNGGPQQNVAGAGPANGIKDQQPAVPPDSVAAAAAVTRLNINGVGETAGDYDVLLVARGLDPRQAAALRNALANQRSGRQRAQFIEKDAEVSKAVAEKASADVPAPGKPAGLVPGVELAVTIAPSGNVLANEKLTGKVDDDGRFVVEGYDAVAAAGLSEAAIVEALVRQAAQRRGGDAPAVTLDRVEVAAAKTESTAEDLITKRSTTRASREERRTIVIVPQPPGVPEGGGLTPAPDEFTTGPATHPADRIDVVVLVRRSAPATQPAATKPAE